LTDKFLKVSSLLYDTTKHQQKSTIWRAARSPCCYLSPVVFIESGVLNYTHGVFIYPLDDVFIHMELASTSRLTLPGELIKTNLAQRLRLHFTRCS
jgi:hypothetical protein